MLTRLVALSYFPLFFLSIGASTLSDQVFLRGLPLMPAAVYVVMRLSSGVLVGDRVRWKVSDGLTIAAFAYVVAYSVLYFPRAFSGTLAIGTLPTLVIHLLFWHLAYSDPVYRHDRRRFFRDLWGGVFGGFVVGFLLTLQHTGFLLRPGTIHNLSREGTFVRSDLDVPMLAVGVTLMGIVWVFFAGRMRRAVARAGGLGGVVNRRAVGVICLLIGVSSLYLYSRRAPMLAVLGSTFLLLLPPRVGRRVVYAAVLIPLVPVVWDIVAQILVLVTQNDVVDAIVARNDIRSYETATNRLAVWLRALAFIAEVRPQHLWGYGGAPAFILAGSMDWQHVHNAFLQLFFDAGLIVLMTAVGLLVWSYYRLNRMMEAGWYPHEVLLIFGYLTAWLVIGAVEPALRAYSVVHMVFLMLVSVTANVYREYRMAAETS